MSRSRTLSTVEAWLGETRRRVGVSREDWLHPAVEALAEALDVGDTDPGPALARLGRARAVAGFTLDEVIEDLRCLHTVADPDRRARLDRLDTLQIARGWADGTTEATRDMGCVEPLTGLTTPAFLRARLAQTYQHCDTLGLTAGDVHTLVVVRLPLDGTAEPHQSLLAVHAAERLRTVFTGGETLTATAGTFLALAANTPDLGAALAALCEPLEPATATSHPAATVARTHHVWIEPLPPRPRPRHRPARRPHPTPPMTPPTGGGHQHRGAIRRRTGAFARCQPPSTLILELGPNDALHSNAAAFIEAALGCVRAVEGETHDRVEPFGCQSLHLGRRRPGWRW